MPRGRKKTVSLTLEEKLESITNEIIEKEKTLKSLKESKKEIEKEIEAKNLKELDQLIKESGKSINDVINFLNKK